MPKMVYFCLGVVLASPAIYYVVTMVARGYYARVFLNRCLEEKHRRLANHHVR